MIEMICCCTKAHYLILVRKPSCLPSGWNQQIMTYDLFICLFVVVVVVVVVAFIRVCVYGVIRHGHGCRDMSQTARRPVNMSPCIFWWNLLCCIVTNVDGLGAVMMSLMRATWQVRLSFSGIKYMSKYKAKKDVWGYQWNSDPSETCEHFETTETIKTIE